MRAVVVVHQPPSPIRVLLVLVALVAVETVPAAMELARLEL
jgi:hypothetical protein